MAVPKQEQNSKATTFVDMAEKSRGEQQNVE
jgi:hypothetical protein